MRLIFGRDYQSSMYLLGTTANSRSKEIQDSEREGHWSNQLAWLADIFGLL